MESTPWKKPSAHNRTSSACFYLLVSGSLLKLKPRRGKFPISGQTPKFPNNSRRHHCNHVPGILSWSMYLHKSLGWIKSSTSCTMQFVTSNDSSILAPLTVTPPSSSPPNPRKPPFLVFPMGRSPFSDFQIEHVHNKHHERVQKVSE